MPSMDMRRLGVLVVMICLFGGQCVQISQPPSTPGNILGEGEGGMSADVFLNSSFFGFTMLCSHNTFLLGAQKGFWKTHKSSTQVSSMKLSLDLGYRCIELDIHPGRPGTPSKHYVPEEPVRILHALGDGLYDLTNSVSFYDMVEELESWLTANDKVEGLKMPIVLSIENHATSQKEEQFMYTIFQAHLGDRIVRKENFTTIFTMASYATKKRSVILKSSLKRYSLKYTSIIAMVKESNSEGNSLESKSISEGKSAIGEVLSKMNESQQKVLIRVYPKWSETNSGNYDPRPFIEAGAHMVCVNIQGYCEQYSQTPQGTQCTETDSEVPTVCCRPELGKATPLETHTSCPCKREWSASLERIFHAWSYDGYMPTQYHAHYRDYKLKVDAWRQEIRKLQDGKEMEELQELNLGRSTYPYYRP